MNKKELVQTIAKEADVTINDADRCPIPSNLFEAKLLKATEAEHDP